MKKSSLRTCMEIIEHYRRRMDAHDAYPVCQSVDMDDVRNISRMQCQGTDEEKVDFREVMERYFQHIQPADAVKLLTALLGDEDNGYVGHKNDAKLFNTLAERLPNLRGEGLEAERFLNLAVKHVFSASLEENSDIMERTQMLRTVLERGADPNEPCPVGDGVISRNAVQELLYRFKNRYMALDVLEKGYRKKTDVLGKAAVSVVKEMAKYGLDPDVPNLQDISARLSLRQYIAFDRTDEAGVLLPRKHAEKIRDVLDKVPTVEKLFTKAIAAKDDNLKAAARSLDTKLHGVLQKYGPYTRRYADERMTEFLEHTLFKKGGDPQMLPFALALSQNIDPSTPHLAYRLLCGIAEMERHGADPAFRDMAVAMVLHCMRDERIDEGNPMTCMELVLTGMKPGAVAGKLLTNLAYCVDPSLAERSGRTPVDILAERTGHRLPDHLLEKLTVAREKFQERNDRECEETPEMTR